MRLEVAKVVIEQHEEPLSHVLEQPLASRVRRHVTPSVCPLEDQARGVCGLIEPLERDQPFVASCVRGGVREYGA